MNYFDRTSKRANGLRLVTEVAVGGDDSPRVPAAGHSAGTRYLPSRVGHSSPALSHHLPVTCFFSITRHRQVSPLAQNLRSSVPP